MEIKMENTNTILNNGIDTFTPLIERLREIVKELIPYFIYIGIWTLGISLIRQAVKYIMWNLKQQTERTIQDRPQKYEIEAQKIDITENWTMENYVNNYNELYEEFEPWELSWLWMNKMRINKNTWYIEEYNTFWEREEAVQYNENNTHWKDYLKWKYKEITQYYNDKF